MTAAIIIMQIKIDKKVSRSDDPVNSIRTNMIVPLNMHYQNKDDFTYYHSDTNIYHIISVKICPEKSLRHVEFQELLV